MKGTCADLDTVWCGQEMYTGNPVYFIAIVLPRPIGYHKTPPVTAGIVCSLNIW